MKRIDISKQLHKLVSTTPADLFRQLSEIIGKHGTGAHYQTIGSWYHGKNKAPLHIALIIAKYYDIEESDFLTCNFTDRKEHWVSRALKPGGELEGYLDGSTPAATFRHLSMPYRDSAGRYVQH